MPRFENGWVKLHRSVINTDLLDNSHLWIIWSWFLIAATVKETEVHWGKEKIKIPPGSIVFGYQELASKFHCSVGTIRKWVKYLHKTNRIICKSCTRGSYVTIRNWELYQSRDMDYKKPNENQMKTEYKPSINQITPIEELRTKELRNIYTAEHDLKSAVRNCLIEWKETLEARGLSNTYDSTHEMPIAKAIATFSEAKVLAAIKGARHEKGNQNFNPDEHMSLSRILNPKNIDRLANLGSKQKPQAKEDYV